MPETTIVRAIDQYGNRESRQSVKIRVCIDAGAARRHAHRRLPADEMRYRLPLDELQPMQLAKVMLPIGVLCPIPSRQHLTNVDVVTSIQ